MKTKILLLSVMALTISQSIKAEYQVNIPLEGSINFNVKDVDGIIKLSKPVINRGESTDITWNYKYADKIDIHDIGVYNNKNGSQTISPVQSTDYNITINNGSKSKEETLHLQVIQPTPEITFSADKYKVGEGDAVNLSWDVKNSDSVTLNNGLGSVNLKSSTTVNPTSNITYTLVANGYFGEKTDNKSISIDVVKNSIINQFTVNKNDFTVGDNAVFNWSVSDSEGLTLSPYGTIDKTLSTQSVPLSSAGSFDYILKTTSYNNSINSSNPIRINVYNEPKIIGLSAPANVFGNAAFTMSWSGTDISTYTITSNSDNSGIPTAGVSNGANTSKLINPTLAGSYTYTVTGTNGAGKTITSSVPVIVSNDPTISAFSANPTSVNTGGSTTLSWATANNGSLSITGVGAVSGTSVAVGVGSIAGTNTYTLTNTKVLNGVTRSATRSASVTVVSACRNDASNNFQVVPIPQTGGMTQVYVIWDGATKYSQQHNGGEGLTQVSGIDGGVYYRASTGVGRFAVCKR